jgi:pyruvate dehydrogenase E1 component alpha subunit
MDKHKYQWQEGTLLETRKYLNIDSSLSSEPKEKISEETLVEIYRLITRMRHLDERMVNLQRQGDISFAMSSLGEEVSIIASAAALESCDWIYPQYREQAALFWRGYNIQDYVHHMFCNGKDSILGRQMPNHFGSRELNVVTVSSPVGTQITHAAGCGYAMKLQKSPEVALCYFGEGTASEGDFHVALNFAAVKKSQTIFFCRNNGFAISTRSSSQFASYGIAERGIAYNMQSIRVDGNDPFAVYDAVRQARLACIAGEGPVLIEAMTYRTGPHSTSDDPSVYREKEETLSWEKELCPKVRLRNYLDSKDLWNDELEEQTVADIKKEVDEAIDTARFTAPPEFESMIEDVYFEVPSNLKKQLEEVAIAKEMEEESSDA